MDSRETMHLRTIRVQYIDFRLDANKRFATDLVVISAFIVLVYATTAYTF